MKLYKVRATFDVSGKVYRTGQTLNLGKIQARALLMRGVIEEVQGEKAPGPSETPTAGPSETKEEKKEPSKTIDMQWLNQAYAALAEDNGRSIRTALAQVSEEPTSTEKAVNKPLLEKAVAEMEALIKG